MDNVQDIKTLALHCQEHSEMNLEIFTFICCSFCYVWLLYTCNIHCHKSLSVHFDEGGCWPLGWFFAAGSLLVQRQKVECFHYMGMRFQVTTVQRAGYEIRDLQPKLSHMLQFSYEATDYFCDAQICLLFLQSEFYLYDIFYIELSRIF
jgi:hypothetical protein